ncbi:STAS domain-containing protein [Kineosporia sp. R_H_3]|uniref:STAS domain-containing protein n=1 Tax=Kineosporia sp. R_H_3 TaxID=1961848 RepID=UPI000B4C1BFC|nr:STAS domain-containing protein [Kineosporia sp. R_H_3]
MTAGVVVLARHDQEVVVRLGDEDLPSGLADLRWHLADHVLCGARSLTVDVSGLGRLSSPAVAVLLRAKRFCRVRGGTVTLRAPSSGVLRMLRTSGLAEVFAIERMTPSGPVPAGVPA